MRIYKASLQDIDTLIRLRLDFFEMDHVQISDEVQKTIRQRLKSYFEKHIPAGDFIAIILEENGEIASVGFLAISEKPASPTFLSGYTGTILNVLTYPGFRNKGCATKVIQRIIEEAKQINVATIDLVATTGGLELYRKLGFKELKYTSMRLKM